MPDGIVTVVAGRHSADRPPNFGLVGAVATEVVKTCGSRPHDLRLNLVRRSLTLYLRNSLFGGLT
jgi:hypothetical protein